MIPRTLLSMDKIDARILEELRLNARQPYRIIGEMVGLSASAVKRRVDRLYDEGVIRAFTIEIEPEADGMSTEAWVQLFCSGTVSPDELRGMMKGIPEIVYAGTVTGDADAIAQVRARSIPALEEALERIRIAPNVDHTKSAIVMSKLINRNNT